MKKVICSTININPRDAEYEFYNNRDGVAIVYYTNSERPYPVFLKEIRNGRFAFVNPTGNYRNTFESDSVEEAVQLASKSREVFVVEKSEFEKLFKVKKK